MYRIYVLGLLMLVYAVNFLDRQVISILAPSLKAAMALTDAQLGLLFGTAFALFFGLFGIPLAHLADGWNRARTIALGLGFWSTMTALSGLASGFVPLALARIGVGIGEASASPAAFSLLSDYFPRARRATALAIYQSGIYVGMGASLVAGGAIVGAWDRAFTPATAPFGLAAWQATFLAFGLPGLALALIVLLTLREPARGTIDGRPPAGNTAPPFAAVGRELAAMIPPWSLFILARRDASGRALRRNLLLLVAIAAAAVLLVRLTDGLLDPARRGVVGRLGAFAVTTNVVQWTAIAIGIYAAASWLQSLRLGDPAAFRLIARTPSFVLVALGGGILSMGSYGLSAFVFVYGTRYLALGPDAGMTLGIITIVAGGLGTVCGGLLADRLRRRYAAGRILVAMLATTMVSASIAVQYTTASVTIFYGALTVGTFFLTMWLGPISATCQDLVPSRMRGVATAVQFLSLNLIGLGLGPYMVGLVSDVTGSLRAAMLSALILSPVVLLCFGLAARRFAHDEAAVEERSKP